jgi:hypothetical protein
MILSERKDKKERGKKKRGDEKSFSISHLCGRCLNSAIKQSCMNFRNMKRWKNWPSHSTLQPIQYLFTHSDHSREDEMSRMHLIVHR